VLDALGEMLDQVEIKREGMVFTSFDTAVRNFQSSYSAPNLFDQVVELATALEACLASGDKDNDAISLRLRSRAAAVLATERDPAGAIFADVGHLYGLRSTIVHGGKLRSSKLEKLLKEVSTAPPERPTMMFRPALGHAIDRMRDLTRRSILMRLCLASGTDPVWPIETGNVSVDRELSEETTRETWRRLWHERLKDLGAEAAADRPREAADFLSKEDR
jgi:hypothetical protein